MAGIRDAHREVERKKERLGATRTKETKTRQQQKEEGKERVKKGRRESERDRKGCGMREVIWEIDLDVHEESRKGNQKGKESSKRGDDKQNAPF